MIFFSFIFWQQVGFSWEYRQSLRDKNKLFSYELNEFDFLFSFFHSYFLKKEEKRFSQEDLIYDKDFDIGVIADATVTKLIAKWILYFHVISSIFVSVVQHYSLSPPLSPGPENQQ